MSPWWRRSRSPPASSLAFDWLATVFNYGIAALLGGVVILLAGAVAAGSAVVAKWLLVGRIRPGEHPLWSSFIWRNEVVDTFIEMVSAPWFAALGHRDPGPGLVAAGPRRTGSAPAPGARATGCPKRTS